MKYRRKHELQETCLSRIFDKVVSESLRSCNHSVNNKCVECLKIEFKIQTSDYVDAVKPLITKNVSSREVPNEWYYSDVSEGKNTTES